MECAGMYEVVSMECDVMCDVYDGKCDVYDVLYEYINKGRVLKKVLKSGLGHTFCDPHLSLIPQTSQ